jgi:DNA adenine methylase
MESYRPVAPQPGLAPWQGGKRGLAARIIARIEAIPHHTYAEPFVGMGGVFLRRRYRAPCEVINDRSGEIVNLYRVVQRHTAALTAELRWAMAARDGFNRLCDTDPAVLTDIERAAGFYWLQRLAYGGRARNRSFGSDAGAPRIPPARAVMAQIAAAHARLQQVTIENLDYGEFIAAYDTPETLFYLDPPYWGGEDDYGKGLFARGDFRKIAAVLGGLKGHFILSINDRPEIREIFAGHRFEEVETTYTIATVRAVAARELLITRADRTYGFDLFSASGL